LLSGWEFRDDEAVVSTLVTKAERQTGMNDIGEEQEQEEEEEQLSTCECVVGNCHAAQQKSGMEEGEKKDDESTEQAENEKAEVMMVEKLKEQKEDPCWNCNSESW